MKLFLITLMLSLLTECLLVCGAYFHAAAGVVVGLLHWPSIMLAMVVTSAIHGDDSDGPRQFPMVILLSIPIAIALWQIAWFLVLKARRQSSRRGVDALDSKG